MMFLIIIMGVTSIAGGIIGAVIYRLIGDSND